MKKILFTSLLFVSACIIMAQQNNSYSDFTIAIWQIDQRQVAVIIDYKGVSAQIIIPDQINGYPVAGIGDNAFRSHHIESVRFPATLVFIGEYAFFDNKLTSVSLPASVTMIGTGAFDNNAISGNTPPRSNTAIYTRTVTIEPTHSDTVFAQKSNPAAQSVNIVVVPGYNPVGSLQQPSPIGIVTVQENKPTVQTPGGNNTALLPLNANTHYAPAQPQTYTQQPQSYTQQPQTYTQQQPQSYTQQPQLLEQQPPAQNNIQRFAYSGGNKFRLVTDPPEEIEPEPLKLQQRDAYPLWKVPIPR
jgi:hypothetical protein